MSPVKHIVCILTARAHPNPQNTCFHNLLAGLILLPWRYI